MAQTNAGRDVDGDERSSLPAAHRMPAEWEPHVACLLLYPHNPSVFRSVPSSDEKCGPARAEARSVARAIARNGGEDVWIYCRSEEEAEGLRRILEREEAEEEGRREREGTVAGGTAAEGGKIRTAVCPSDDSWMRDTGPTFAVPRRRRGRRRRSGELSAAAVAADEHGREAEGGPADDGGAEEGPPSPPADLIALDWDFNAYGGPPAADGSGDGGCYWPCDLDRRVARNVVSHLRKERPSLSIRRRPVDLVLEGGSVHVDGEGTVLATEECLLHPNRNPHLSRGEIESMLLRELGATRVLWLPLGLAFDADTNGHVDNFCAFVKPGEVVLAWTDDEEGNGENYRRCRLAEEALGRDRDARGRRITVRRLRLPRPQRYAEEGVRALEGADGTEERTAGERLAASYVNFYIANHAVVVPQFGDETADEEALVTLRELFPDREVVGVYSREILLGGGNIHCITQQVPRVDMN